MVLPLALQSPDPRVSIRPVLPGDAALLRACCWPDRSSTSLRWLIERMQRVAEQDYGLGVVAEAGEEIIGYGQVTLWPRCGEISDLVVAEPARGHGVGTAIIQHLCRASVDMHASTLEIGAARSNTGALTLYRRLGFQDHRSMELHIDGQAVDVVYLRLPLAVYENA